jgi:hypothetical protein
MSKSTGLYEQAFNLLCDQQLGAGMSRRAFSSKLMPTCVVKVEDGAGQFQNVIEWETWDRVQETEFARWFAPCRFISANGALLVMDRTRPPAPHEFPKRMPVFLTDFKRTNYGMLRDPKTGVERFVCHDYGTHLLFEEGMSRRLRKAAWWDAE